MHRKKTHNVLLANPSKMNSLNSSAFQVYSSILQKEKSVNKSLVDPSGLEIIQVSHQEINFINTEINQIYEISLSIRNVSNKFSRVKYTKPKSQYLSISPVQEPLKKNSENITKSKITSMKTKNKESLMNLAPGLQIKLNIIFNCQINEIIKDKIMIYLDDGSYEHQIPINVYPVVNYLGFEGFLDFGIVKPGSKKQMTVQIENKGKNIAEIRLEPSIKGSSKAKIQVYPLDLQIQPQTKQKVTVIISSIQIGQVEGIIDLLPHYVTQYFIEFCGIFCQSNRYIANQNGEQISQIALPPMFSGQTKKLSLNLVNNTLKNCQYRIIRKKSTPFNSSLNSDGSTKTDDQQNMCLITPEQFGRDDEYEQKIIKIAPFQGQIKGYSKQEIQCQVLAKFQENDYQIFCNYTAGKIKMLPYQSTQWSYVLKTYFSDDDPPKTLTIKGQSIIPKISLSAASYDFGQIAVRKKSQKLLRIENYSQKPMFIKLQKSNSYKFNVTSFALEQNECKEVNIVFSPQICGQLHEICYLKIGQFSFPIKMVGKGVFSAQKNKIEKKNCIQNSGNKKYQTIGTQNDQMGKGIEVEVDDLDMPPEISMINQRSYIVQDTHNKSISFNYDTSLLKVKLGKPQKPCEKIKKTVKNKSGKQIIIDPNNFNPNQEIEQYPGPVKNQQEQRFITRQLTLHQFRNISVGPVILQFGEVFVQTPQKKTFHICNFNNKPISIQLDTKNQSEFDKSSKNVQILPSQSHGGISVVLHAFKQGNFKFPLQYSLNGRHYFQLVATGTAILPTVKLSKNQFKFIANQQDPSFHKRQDLTLKNVYPYQVKFCFHQEKQSNFKIVPENGIIPPNSKKQVTISHSFEGILQGGGKIQENIKLKIQNGQKFDIKCVSIVPDAQLTCKPGQLNFKQISICKQHEMKFSIRNPSRNFTIFKIIPNKNIQDMLSIQSSSTSLNSDEVAQINVKLYCGRQDIVDSGITVIVRGGKNIFIPIKANIIIPKVKIEGDVIDFGSMPVSGNPNIKHITLINQSSISAQLDLVLQNDSFMSKCLSIKQDTNENVTVLPPIQAKQYKVKIFPIKLGKKCKTQINLQFVPEEVKQYNFLLPLYLSGCSDSFPSLQRNVICQSQSDRLIVDHRVIDFGKIIIQQSIEHVPKSFLINLKNPCQEQIQWWINNQALQPFQLQKKSGTLKGLQETKLKVYLYNDNVGVFERQLQFFINKTNLSPKKPYLKIIVKASANYPELYFDRPYVIMPVVKIGEQSVANFEIINGGYQNLHLKHIICEESSLVNFKISYPTGSNLSITKKSLVIELSFKSDKPISFTYKIDFYDHHNRIFSIFASGTADNSLYTIPQNQWAENFETQIDADCVFLKNYLNCLGFVEQPLYDFPDSLADGDYEGLQKLLAYYNPAFEKFQKIRIGTIMTSLNTNGNLSQATKKNLANYAMNTQESYQYLNEIIKYLKAQGAYLSQIRPQFLMKQNQFSEIITGRAENTRISKYYSLPTEKSLVFQIFKVCSRVPIKKKNNDFLLQFPARLKAIIQWLQGFYQSEDNIDQFKHSNQLKDLGDGQLLSELITKYTNITITENYRKNNMTYKQKQRKCKKIIDTFNQIGITSGVKVGDLLKSKSRQMIVFLLKLYTILPSYLQKGQPIIFSCAVGQTLTKSIQIKNPSKYPVNYLTNIQGSKAYVIQGAQQFTVQGKKHQISIKYISNIDLTKNNATLTITGKTLSKFTPSTFIFVLKSNKLGKLYKQQLNCMIPMSFKLMLKTISIKIVFQMQQFYLLQGNKMLKIYSHHKKLLKSRLEKLFLGSLHFCHL